MVDLIFIFRVITSKVCDCEVFANFFCFDFRNESNGARGGFFLPTNFDFELDITKPNCTLDNITKPNCTLDKRTILCLYVPGFQMTLRSQTVHWIIAQFCVCMFLDSRDKSSYVFQNLGGFFISFKSYCCPELNS